MYSLVFGSFFTHHCMLDLWLSKTTLVRLW
jgi:hypothetical protein